MPLEIETKVYRKRDLRADGPILELDIPYAPIYQWGYGRVDMSSPVKGLATCNVASCTAVVIHSPESKRTVLTHSPNYMLTNLTFIPIVSWVICKGEDNYNPKSRIEVVILRGFEYNQTTSYGHAHPEWVRDFKQMLNLFGTHPNHVIDDKPLEVSSNGMVYVDKETGKVTRITIPEMKHGHPMLQVVNKRMDVSYSWHQRTRDSYVGGAIQKILEHNLEELPTLHLQYDVNKYMPAIAMPDSARITIRNKISLNKDTPDPLHGWRNDLLMESMLANIKKIGLPCERCHKPGEKKCVACKGAWYCSKEHQLEDWKNHKKFCKANKIN